MAGNRLHQLICSTDKNSFDFCFNLCYYILVQRDKIKKEKRDKAMKKTIDAKINECRNTAANLLREADRIEKMSARYSHILGYLTNLPEDQVFTGGSLSKQCPSINPMESNTILKLMSSIYPSVVRELIGGVTHCFIPARLEG